ncbi:MAG: hypothetical protein KBT12_08475 [Bacteroidales bacterium]|nr:hypothetical protein [Candidatus Physcousia equi]
MKKTTLLLLLLLVCCLSSRADEQRKLNLNNTSNRTSHIELSYANIFVTEAEEDKDGQAVVTVELENTNETCVLVVFGQSMNEKEVKKQTGITFDKTFPGKSGKRTAENMRMMKEVSSAVPPMERITLCTFCLEDGEATTVDLPIYIAKPKDKKMKKLVLMERDLQQLDITASLQPDEQFNALSEQTAKLAKEIKGALYCNNKNHRGNDASDLKSSYKKKVKSLTGELLSAKKACNEGGSKAQKYQNLVDELASIDIDHLEEVSACKNDKKTKEKAPKVEKEKTESCKYENKTLQQLYNTLDDMYQKVYSGKTTKKKVMGEVNAIYKCVSSHNHWKTGTEYKSGISKIYNKINAM